MMSLLALIVILSYITKTGSFFLGNKESDIECGQQMVKKGRVIGGSDVYDGEFPFIVSIRKTQLSHENFCGGAILNEQWILTAAHCVYRMPRDHPPLSVHYGANGCGTNGNESECQLSVMGVAQVMIHPEFMAHTFGSDIALLKLNEHLNFTRYTWPVCLPQSATQLYGREATVAGWGFITNTKCQEMYDEAESSYNIHIQNSQMCAGYREGKRDACQGDSGGPLFVVEEGKFTVIGLVSAGVACAMPLLPGIYTKVPLFLPWILDVMKNTS